MFGVGVRARRDERGFSLVELTVVMIILAVLAAIALRTYFSQRESAARASAVSTLHNVQLAAESIHTSSGTYAVDLDTYDDEAGSSYVFLEASASPAGPRQVSLDVVSDDVVVAATRGSSTCFYLRVSRNAVPSRRSAPAGTCRAADFSSAEPGGW